ncbi:trypsin-like peptidase domain-containing protein [Streptomyces sp. NPDC001663]|uniref:S1C family serine protease n=1 Tax=Streptomyces sp. NPDC001663 TaxID=3364597 RepID=UPI0036BB27CE
MNEGKPTKPKWWSRPRPQGPADTDPASTESAETASGDDGADRVRGGDGDFELVPPAAVGGGEAVSPDGDYELRHPQDVAGSEPADASERVASGAGAPGGAAEVGAAERASGTGVPEQSRHEGDFELERPAVPAVGPADLSPTPTTTRLKPLHDPDPYSTPPYGEPGPWAPAPPVQHPAATPAQGTAAPTPPAAHGMPSAPHVSGEPVGPAPHDPPAPAPSPAVPSPAPTAPAPSAPAPSHATPTPIPAPAPLAPGHAGPVPVSDPPPPSTPWQNYDPWAPAPLQQNGAAIADKDTRRRRVRRALVGGAVALALVSGGVGGALGAYLERNGGVGAVELPQAGKEPVGRAPDSVAGIAARALPSVVTLHVTGADESGTGTGFVLDDRGHILTNNHVVEPAGTGGTISVTFNSGDTAKATVVGRDSGYDLAVVKVSGVTGLKPMALGNSDNVQVGDPVVAIGAPFDLEGTVTSGIISAKERPITAGGDSSDGSDVSYVDALQTDAPINPGNSGGPLLDSKARVIGINSAIRSADDGSDSGGGQAGSIGLGFAIPVNQAKRVAEELINTGKATHPVIGVTLDMDYTGDGARVGAKATGGGPAVSAGGPGDKAGIKAGDIITEVDGQRIHSGEELIVKTRAHRPGDRLELTVKRDGKEKKISLVLGSADGN